MNNAIHKRKIKIMLEGGCGNMGLSYDGMELLPELLRSGRWLRLWREARSLATQRMRWRGVFARTFGPWCPGAIWAWLNKIANGHALQVGDYTAIHPRRFAELNLLVRAKARKMDLFAARGKAALRCGFGFCRGGTLAITAKGVSRVGRSTIGTPLPTSGCWNSVLRFQRNSSFAMESQGR
jgi:hypothetical protein